MYPANARSAIDSLEYDQIAEYYCEDFTVPGVRYTQTGIRWHLCVCKCALTSCATIISVSASPRLHPKPTSASVRSQVFRGVLPNYRRNTFEVMLANPIMPVMDDLGQTFGDRFVREVRQIVTNPANMLNESLASARAEKGSPELDILSADRYPSAPLPSMQARKEMKRRASQQLYGGFLNDDNMSSNSSNEAMVDDKVPPKKRSKRASKVDEDDASKKQRGRPRLDTQDETAADRRRTQIRLAQRAYRHRKETTISALKKKVGDLEKTIQTMNNAYIELHDNLIDTGLFNSRTTLLQQLKSTAEQFATSARLVQDSDNEDDDNQHDDRHRTDSAEVGHEHTSSSNNARTKSNVSSQDSGQGVPGYKRAYSQDSGNELDIEVSDLQLFQAPNFEDTNVQEDFQQWNVQIPDTQFDVETFFPTIEKPLKATQPYTYSFQETTFSRRLHRLCLERAFRNLTAPDMDRDYITRAFRFTFCFSNKKSMLIRFQELLKRKAGESLENWNVPFFRVGGAGTHFPRRDEAGRPIYPPNMHSPASVFRPLRWLEVETPRAESTTEKMLEAIGYGGDWFDSHDVEEYLKTKGIYLDGSSSFIEIDPAAISLPSLTTTASTPILDPAGSPIRTPSPGVTPHMEGYLDQEVLSTFANNGIFDFLATAENPDKTAWPHTLDFGFAQHSPSYTPTLQDLIGNKQTPVTVDVSKFLERMVDGAACLGRAPGFRKSHIDNALALSLQEAF